MQSQSPRINKQRGSFELLALVAILCAVIALLGYAVVHLQGKQHALKAELEKAGKTITTEREQRDAANASALATHKRWETLNEFHENTKQQLATALADAPDAHLPGPVGRVLRTSSRPAAIAAAATAQPGQEAPAAAFAGSSGAAQGDDGSSGPVSCKAIAEWGHENVAIARENAAHVEGLQDFYDEQRAILEKAQAIAWFIR